MKAIRVSEYGGPAVLKLEEIPTPQPGPGQVLVRNHAVGINPVDTYLRSQHRQPRARSCPTRPGCDAAGVVEAVGSGVTAREGGRPRLRGRLGDAAPTPSTSLCDAGAGAPAAAERELRAGRGR